MREAAAYFHTGGISGFLNHSVEHRAEMMAHMLIKSVRDDYIEEQRRIISDRIAKRGKESAGYNPADNIKRQWML
jgi:hypothetical protein